MLIKDYDGGTLYASDNGIDPKERIPFDIGKLYAYIRKQRENGRNPEDITLEEVEPFIRKKS